MKHNEYVLVKIITKKPKQISNKLFKWILQQTVVKMYCELIFEEFYFWLDKLYAKVNYRLIFKNMKIAEFQ